MNDGKTNVIGVDFGSDSVRAIVVDTSAGSVLSAGAACYRRWKRGLYQHPDQAVFRQHPLDYLEAFTSCVRAAVEKLSAAEREKIVGIGVDTTGSTPAPVDREGLPLAMRSSFAENENAMFHLWKDHSAWKEAAEINDAFSHGSSVNYCRYMGTYSAEWFWAKILHAVRTEPELREHAYFWVEHCDWMVGVLTGNSNPDTMYHSACAAGHKAFWHSSWEGLPAGGLLGGIDPYLADVRSRFVKAPEPAAVRAGKLTPEWAERLGLPEGVVVSGSSFDAHAGAVGAGIDENILVSTIGTSAVDMMISKPEALMGKDLTRYGGQAENSILPGYIGIETGQAAFGDIFAWYRNLLLWSVTAFEDRLDPAAYGKLLADAEDSLLQKLEQAAAQADEFAFPIALDWFNGRRYPDNDDSQRSVIAGLSLGCTAPVIYRSLVFGAVSGLKRICDGFEGSGLAIERIRAVGGISKKSPYVMQMMADVLEKEISVLDNDQTCALGAAFYAAMAAGCFSDIRDGLKHMAAKEEKRYYPDVKRAELLRGHYRAYLELAEKVSGGHGGDHQWLELSGQNGEENSLGEWGIGVLKE